MIDLSLKESFDVRQIKNLPLYESCTYRVFSTCGYPNAAVKILNPILANDFDIHYSTQTGKQRDEDLASEWQLDDKVDWSGAFQSGADGALDFISEGYTNPKVDATTFAKCNGPNKNLWITVTRVKVSTNAVQSESFLSLTPRELQGLNQYDIEFGFASIQGNAKFLSAISLALVALLSVFAF